MVPPNSHLNEYEDGENTTVLFKVLCIGGLYFLYHKDSLNDEAFCDTTHMVHLVLKDLSEITPRFLAGDIEQK